MNPIPSCSGWGTQVRGPDVPMADMSDGGYVDHTCGVAASDGHMECWGLNECNRSDAPTTGAYSFTSVGRYGSCAIVHTTVIASCWGCDCSSNDKGQCDVRCPVLHTLTSKTLFIYVMRHYLRQLHAADIMANTLYCNGNASVERCLTGCDALCTPNSCVQRICL